MSQEGTTSDHVDRSAADRSEEEWRERLTPEQFAVTRQGATEPPFSGTYVDEKDPGVYRCVACQAPLFTSETKFDSGTGWPSFTAPTESGAVRLCEDTSLGMRRVEVRCAACDSHLGHVFRDGPPPSGQRWCINSAALDLDRDA